MSEVQEQTRMLMTEKQSSSVQVSSANAFSCCSRYKVCSDKGSCLIPELDYSNNCTYRKNLEGGAIYYGKNGQMFKPDVYLSFSQKVEKLSQRETEILQSILFYFFLKIRFASYIIFPDIQELHQLAQNSFIQIVNDPRLIVNRCKLSVLRDACGGSIETAIKWVKSKCSEEEWEQRKTSKIYRDELVDWIIKYNKAASDILCQKLLCIKIDFSTRYELEEFFFDYLYQNDFQPILEDASDDPRFLAKFSRKGKA